MSAPARTPNPFFSVCTISIGAYCLFWNLSRTFGHQSCSGIELRETDEPLVLTMPPTPTVAHQALDLHHPVDAIRVFSARFVRIRFAWSPFAKSAQLK